MFSVNRRLAFTVAIGAALVMLFVLTSVAFAGTDTTKTICVDGYVINHRELAVDGTKTTPPLYVEAVGANGIYSATVASNGYFKFKDLPEGEWNFQLQLPEGWEGIVPAAEIAGIAETGVTPVRRPRRLLPDRLQGPTCVRRDGRQMGRAARWHRAAGRRLDDHRDAGQRSLRQAAD